MTRPRTVQLVACAVTIALGLLSRVADAPAFVIATFGDALYAVLIYGLLGLVAPRATIARVAAVAWAICAAIEISQAWHPAWLDALRAHRPVALVLGRGFLWSDLACYAVGVGIAACVESLAYRITPCQRPIQ